jgi:hypothetical protein
MNRIDRMVRVKRSVPASDILFILLILSRFLLPVSAGLEAKRF